METGRMILWRNWEPPPGLAVGASLILVVVVVVVVVIVVVVVVVVGERVLTGQVSSDGNVNQWSMKKGLHRWK